MMSALIFFQNNPLKFFLRDWKKKKKTDPREKSLATPGLYGTILHLFHNYQDC